jgi:bifunctional non-homologous end joining protein LigD
LRQLLEPLVIDRPALTHAVRKTEAKWVRPGLSATIQYRALTSDGLLRHASFNGVRRPIDAQMWSKPRAR